MNRLQEKYNNEIVPAMIEKFGYKNIMQVPKLNKIVINMGVGEANRRIDALPIFRRGSILLSKQKTTPKYWIQQLKILRSSQVRKLLSQRLKNLSLTSRSEKAFQSVVK